MSASPRRRLLRALCAGLVLAGAAASGTAVAQRALPEAATYGELTAFAPPSAVIDKRVYRVAPGFRFRDHDNRIMVPVPPAVRGKVAFTRDTMGQVLGLWLLTPREIAAFEARLKSR